MNEVWVQYTDADPAEAAVCQTAGCKREAKQDDEIFPGNPWFRYEVAGDGVSLINRTGPFVFGTPQVD